MGAGAARVRQYRERLKAAGLREVRIVLPDARSPEVRARIAAQMANLDPEEEAEALRWIEAVSMFDNEDLDETR